MRVVGRTPSGAGALVLSFTKLKGSITVLRHTPRSHKSSIRLSPIPNVAERLIKPIEGRPLFLWIDVEHRWRGPEPCGQRLRVSALQPWEGCDLIAAMRRDQISVPWVIDGRSKTGSSSSCRRACIHTRTGRNGHPRQPRQPQGQRRSPSFRARGVTASSCRPTAPTSVRSSKSWESLKAFYALQSLAT